MAGKDRYTEDRQQFQDNYSNNQCIIEKPKKGRGINRVREIFL